MILSDLRDVIFKKDPRGIQHSELDCYLEDGSMTLGKYPHNSRWIKSSYGEETLEKLKDGRISCGGVTIGTQEGIEYYLRSMIEDEAGLGHPRYCGFFQAMHNDLIHTGKLNCRVVENEQGDVYTAGYTDGILIKKHVIHDRKGHTPYIVHQYDRHIRTL